MEDWLIYLAPFKNQWWFEIQPTSLTLQPARKFVKRARNLPCVFAAITLEQPLLLPDEDEENPAESIGLPPELQQYQHVFEDAKATILPSHRQIDHAIELEKGKQPPFGPIYPLSPKELEVLKTYIKDGLNNNRIRPSKSPAGAPILFVPKKDGSLRLCVDYRGLNKVTIKNRYPLPLISELLDRVTGAKWFTKLDIKDAYHRIRIKKGDEWKTAFRTRYGHYEYLVLPFGLTNAPATFQTYIQQSLHDILDVFCVAYLDDILIFSPDRETHTFHVLQVLQRLETANLWVKLSKCSFYQQEVDYLGFIISDKGVGMDRNRVKTIQEWPEPQTYHDIQVFLGFCNFYRRFIHRYSAIAAPLTALLRGSKDGRKPGKANLTDNEKRAFRNLIHAFEDAPLLRHYDPTRRIRLETDASQVAMAGILSQPDDEGKYHPVAFWSRKFKGPELDYGTPDQEMMAIVESFKHWRHYLEGNPHQIEVLSDHQNLRTFMNQPKLSGRQARWCMYLAPFDFLISHRPGKRNPADAPSRRPDYTVETVERPNWLPSLQTKLAVVERLGINQEGLPSYPVWVEQVLTRSQTARDLVTTEKKDPKGAPPLQKEQEVPNEAEETQFLLRNVARAAASKEDVYEGTPSTPLLKVVETLQLKDKDAIMRRRRVESQRLPSNSKWSVRHNVVCYDGKLLIPDQKALKQELLSIYHTDPLAGHFGIGRTKELLRRKFYWKNLDNDVREYIADCTICKANITPRHKPYGKLESLPIPQGPFEELSMDFITGLPLVRHKEEEVDAILVIVDRYTKYSLVFPVSSTINSAQLAHLFHNEVELKFGAPSGIVSDRGPVFTSQFWADLCYLSRIKRRLSTAFHPQTDGQTERMNQTLEQYLRCFVNEEQTNWPALLNTAQFAMNQARNATTGISPAEALLEYNPEFHLRIEDNSSQTGDKPLVPAAKQRLEKLEEVRKRLEKHYQQAVETHQKYYNQKHTPLHLKTRSLVGLSTKNLRFASKKRKLIPKYIGPFRVLGSVGKQAYRLQLPTKYDRLHNVFPVSLLEPWDTQNEDPTFLPMPDLDDTDPEWEVEEVVGETTFSGEKHYLVKWEGWPSEYNQWIPEADMDNARESIKKYHKKEKAKQKKSLSAKIVTRDGAKTTKTKPQQDNKEPQ